MDAHEKRLYQRGEHFYIEAKTSRDKIRWRDATINNLSSGGLQLLSNEVYEVGHLLWFDLKVQGFFSEFETKVQGEVRNVRRIEDVYAYGVIFLDLSNDKRILIDENIKQDRPVGGDPYSFDV